MSRFTRSLSYAFNGIKECVVKGANFRIQLLIALPVAGAGIFFGISRQEWLIITGCIGFVLCMEMLNTAIEQLCDVVHKTYHPGIKTCKDIAAAAVLLSAFIALICGCIIFIPKVISFI